MPVTEHPQQCSLQNMLDASEMELEGLRISHDNLRTKAQLQVST